MLPQNEKKCMVLHHGHCWFFLIETLLTRIYYVVEQLHVIVTKIILLFIDFQKAAAFLHEFLLKLNEESECAELRDVLNLALLQLQKYYRQLQNRSQDKNVTTLSLTARGLSPMTPFVDAPDKFQWKWLNLDSIKNITGVRTDESMNITVLPPLIDATKQGDYHTVKELIADGKY